MTAQKKIGFLGGTFDPIHFGHLNLAIEALEQKKLDEIWFCPTALSPHKQGQPPLPIEHRIKMLKLALEGMPQCKIITNEAYASCPPYTFDTLTSLKEDPQNQDKKFYLILAQDLLSSLHTWHEIDSLIEGFPFIVANRCHDKSLCINELNERFSQKINEQMISVRTLEISSENLRKRLKNNLYCRHLTPLKVLDYIYENELY